MEMSVYRALNARERRFLVQESCAKRKFKGNEEKLVWAVSRLEGMMHGLSDEGKKIAEYLLKDLKEAVEQAKESSDGKGC